MNDQTSKNIIIIILIVLVLGLVGVIYVNKTNNNSLDGVGDQKQTETSEPVTGGRTSNSTETPIHTSQKGPKVEDTSLAVPIITSLPQIDVSQVNFAESVAIVMYSDSGFIPPVVEVVAGNSVTFINSSNKPLWVTSLYHPTAKAQYYPGFDQGKSASNGGTYTFNFAKIGVWGYKNLNFEKHLGAISVVEQ